MKYGFVLPRGDARMAGEMAALAEQAGWDGFFVWEPVWGVDAWIQLTVAALHTERIRLGTMLTPLSRMRPWKLASETATLDVLSGGRVNLAVGLGAVDTGFDAFGEITDRRVRAELLDEGLAILTGLWAGQPFSFQGQHYQIQPTDFLPPPHPLQQPRIPIWVVGAIGSEKSLGRALRYDGILPQTADRLPNGTRQARQINQAELAELSTRISAEKGAEPFDIIIEGATPADDPAAAGAIVREWANAGATWWIEALWGLTDDDQALKQRISAGPPGF